MGAKRGLPRLAPQRSLMTPQEYRDALATLGLDHRTAWPFLGVSQRTHFRYLEEGAPEPIRRLLALATHVGLIEAQRIVGTPAHEKAATA